MTPTRAIALGGLTVGVLDGLDALIFFGVRGVPPIRVFQAIASGLLGREAFQGGGATLLLGVALHFLIATTVVAVYVIVSRITSLNSRPLVFGPLYGVAVDPVMNLVVIPLSAIGGGPPRAWPVILNGILINMIGVGLPSALFARTVSSPAR